MLVPPKTLPVVYSGLTPFINNKILERAFMSQYPGGEALTVMAEKLIAAGYEFMTIDHYLKQDCKRPALLISDMASGQDSATGLIPAICMSLESPIVSYRYYHQLDRRTRRFHKVWDWPGVAPRVRDRDRRFLPNAWPTTAQPLPVLVPWQERRFLTVVSSNKRAMQRRWQPFGVTQPQRWVRDLLIDLDCNYIRSVDPWMKSELYLERLRAINHFARYDDFDLYGNGWDTLRTEPEQQVGEQIARSWRGPIQNKGQTLAQYRFYLCFENTAFPGYLTEKLFDCFFSGVIPVYLGDPDIHRRVPQAAFIDARRFSSYQELDDYLQSITPAVARDYLEAARQFLQSEAFQPFTGVALVNTIVTTLNQIYEQYR